MLGTPVTLTPKQFEEEVESLLIKLGVGLVEFKVQRLENIDASNGSYEIDVTARFDALGVNFLVLIECKHHKNPIKRDVVQVLFDRLRAVGGHKGMVFSTARFQRGAIEFAKAHGIALVRIADGRTSFATRSYDAPQAFPPLPSGAPFVGWLIGLTEDGDESFRLISGKNPEMLFERFRS